MIKISNDRYGETAIFRNMDDAQDTIRACGPDFAETTLEMRGGMIYDETGEKIGHAMHACRVSDRMGTLASHNTRWYDTWGEAHAAAERLCKRHFCGDRGQITEID